MFMTIHFFTFTYAYLHDGLRNLALASENPKSHIGLMAAFSGDSVGTKISQVISSLTSALASISCSLK